MSLQENKEINVSALTGGEVAGSGIFDELMRSVKAHLIEEYNAGRITGNDYANVYLNMQATALQNATNFLLQQEVANQQVRLMDEQINRAKEDTNLVLAQIAKIQADTALVGKQEDKLDQDILIGEQQLALATEQVETAKVQTDLAEKDLLIKDEDLALRQNQVILAARQADTETAKASNLQASTTKANAETGVLNQRAKTEEAQIKDTVDGQPVGGIVGKQMTLYTNQADGYIRDAEQKAAKLMSDIFITRVSTDWDNPSAVTANVDDTSVGRVITKLASGVGVSV